MCTQLFILICRSFLFVGWSMSPWYICLFSTQQVMQHCHSPSACIYRSLAPVLFFSHLKRFNQISCLLSIDLIQLIDSPSCVCVRIPISEDQRYWESSRFLFLSKTRFTHWEMNRRIKVTRSKEILFLLSIFSRPTYWPLQLNADSKTCARHQMFKRITL